MAVSSLHKTDNTMSERWPLGDPGRKARRQGVIRGALGAVEKVSNYRSRFCSWRPHRECYEKLAFFLIHSHNTDVHTCTPFWIQQQVGKRWTGQWKRWVSQLHSDQDAALCKSLFHNIWLPLPFLCFETAKCKSWISDHYLEIIILVSSEQEVTICGKCFPNHFQHFTNFCQ